LSAVNLLGCAVSAPIEPPDAEIQAARLLELARVYVGDTLELPAELAQLRQLLAEQMLEVGMLRLDVADLKGEIERLKGGRS